MKKIIINLSLSFLGIIFAILLAEEVVRIFKLSPLWEGVKRGYYNDDLARFFNQDKTFKLRPKPNLDLILQKWQGEFKMRWQTNSKGFRGKEIPYQRTNNKKRILFLGDSFGWGFGVDNLKMYSSILQSKHDKILEVVNLSVSGYDLLKEYLMYKTEGIKYAPDIIILLFYIGDDIYPDLTDEDINNINGPYFILKNDELYFQPREFSLLTEEEFEHFGRRRGFLNDIRFIIQTHSALSNLLFERLSNFPQFIPFLRKMGGAFIVEQRMHKTTKEDVFITVKILKKFQTEAKSNNSDFIVILIPDTYHVDTAIKKNFIDYKDRTYEPIFWLTKELESERIPCINLLEEFTSLKFRDKRLYFTIDRHLNPEGNKALAGLIEEFLFKHHFIAR
ncbi:MAG: hypothetical protein V1674_02535 [Candidatus Omnitrophota bacterium]